MNTKLIILGVNIIALSLIALGYAAETGIQGLIGISYSTLILGIVTAAFGYAYTEPIVDALLFLTKSFINGLTAIIENLDLVGAKPSIVRKNGTYYLVYSRIKTAGFDPGVGSVHESPYVSIPLPIDTSSPTMGGINEGAIESVLSEYLVSRWGVCRKVVVSVSGNYVRITLHGVEEKLNDLSDYPVQPLVIIGGALLAHVTGAREVSLLEGRSIPGGRYMVFKVGGVEK